MKKIILSLTVIGMIAFTSCKKEADTAADTTEQTDTTDANDETVVDNTATEDVVEAPSDVPQFENADVQSFVDEYTAAAKELKEIAASGNVEKLQEAQTKITELAQKQGEVLKNLTDSAEQQKFTDWYNKLAEELAQ